MQRGRVVIAKNIEMLVSVNGHWQFSDFSLDGFIGHSLVIDPGLRHVKVTTATGLLRASIAPGDIVSVEFKESDE